MARNYRRILRAPRKLLFTRDGRWFVGMTIFVGAGAVNTGNNLLYLVLGMMLGLIIVSGILSERVLKGITVERIPTGDVFARRPTRVNYEITNQKSVFPSFSIVVAEHEAKETRSTRRVALGLPAEVPRKKKERDKESDPGTPRALAVRIPPGKAVVATGEYVFPQRGLYRYVGLDIGTRFPFGFFEKIRPHTQPSEILVYPEVRTEVAHSDGADSLDGEVNRHDVGRGGEFFGLQEFRDGDDRRDVHWKVSARRGVLVRKLYEREENETFALHLYNWAPSANDGIEPAARAAVEESIVEVASTAARLTREGRRFSLHTIGEQVPDGVGAGHLKVVLRHLALLDVRTGEAPPMDLSRTPNRLLFAPNHTPPSVLARFEAVFGKRRAA